MQLLKKIISGLIIVFPNYTYSQQIQFAKTYFSFGDNVFGNFLEMPDSTFYLTGLTGPVSGNSSLYKGLLVHINKFGDTLFTRKYDTTALGSIEPFNDTSFVVNGYIYYPNSSVPHFSVAKMNLNGDTIWKKQFAYPLSSSCPSYAGAMHKCSDNGYVMLSNEACDYGWFKIDSTGAVIWHNWNNMPETCYEIKPDLSNGYVSVGSGGGGLEPYEVAYIDSGGMEIWHRQYGNNPSGNDYNAVDVVVMDDSNFVVGSDVYYHGENSFNESSKKESENLIIVSPNPFTSNTQITYRKKIDKLRIFNMLQQDITRLFEFNNFMNSDRATLTLTNISGLKGIYFCVFDFADRSKQTSKLIIE